MATPKLIGLIGYAGSGKSTVAKILVQDYGYMHLKFANILKDMLRVLGLNEDEIEGSMKEKPSVALMGKSPRHAMITLGTEWGRNMIHNDLWVDATMRDWRRRSKLHAFPCVIDDVRFPNEANAIRREGGVIWRVERTNTTAQTAHESEAGQSRIISDRTLFNTTSIQSLERLVLEHLK